MESIRQGDVLLRPVDKIQGSLTDKKEKILAFGEVTGHKHILRGEDTKFYKHNNQVLVEVGEHEAELIHDEHKQLHVPKGLYQVVIQREWSLQQQVQQVTD